MNTSSLLLLHPHDNVLICRVPIAAGEILLLDDHQVVAPGPIQIGHKVARVALAPGDKVLRYGAPIGTITAATAAGAHVHLHNLKSDYIPSHTRAGRL